MMLLGWANLSVLFVGGANNIDTIAILIPSFASHLKYRIYMVLKNIR